MGTRLYIESMLDNHRAELKWHRMQARMIESKIQSDIIGINNLKRYLYDLDKAEKDD